MRTAARATIVLALEATTACTQPRALSLCASLGGDPNCTAPTGVHPAGWADPKSPSFHQRWLRANGDDLAGCRGCHGADYAGGGVGVSCLSSGCHTRPGGPEFCGTCHGGPSGPLPATGAHALHAAFCADCHDIPKSVSQPDHITGSARVAFSGLASAGGRSASYDASTKTCSNVYCHVDATPAWQPPPAVIGCAGCHAAPPPSHAAWARVATPPNGASPAQVAATCSRCHPVPTPGATPAAEDPHVDGTVELAASIACDTCHGRDPSGAPPVALDGTSDPSSRGVGAHEAHLSESLPNRIGRAVACATCHVVPQTVTAAGHLDHALPATVALPQGGAYDPAKQGCTVWCHWDANAGVPPTWTDTIGAIVAPSCTGCHGFPPLVMRDGRTHTRAPSELSACLACHPFGPSTHVDGLVETVP